MIVYDRKTVTEQELYYDRYCSVVLADVEHTSCIATDWHGSVHKNYVKHAS